MDDRRFDSLVKSLATARNRRTVLKGFLGLGATAIAGTRLEGDAGAARRGYPGPKIPTPVVVGAPGCNPLTCYGCRECVKGVCTDNPGELCYQHACRTSVCDPDGGCSYPLDCRTGDNCCGFDQFCDLSNGVCTDCPGNLCNAGSGPICCSGATPNCCDQNGTLACVAADVCCSDDNCTGCFGCVNGTCVPNNNNCYVQDCRDSVCDPDGGCRYPLDCRKGDNCCTGGEVCGADGQCTV